MGNGRRISRECSHALTNVLSKVVTENQLLILSNIDGRHQSLTSFLNELAEATGVPLSTLKLGVKTLNGLGLIELERYDSIAYVRLGLTEAGRLLLEIIRDR